MWLRPMLRQWVQPFPLTRNRTGRILLPAPIFHSLAMAHLARPAFDRPMAMLVALAVAWLPAGPRTSCGCESCDCHEPTGDSCCCESPSASACYADAPERTCCDEARSAGGNCRCEIRRSQMPAAPLVHGRPNGCSTDSGIAGPIAYPFRPQSDTSLALNRSGLIRSGPSLRVLYCVWRN